MLIRGWGLSTTCRTGREAYGGSECQHVVTLLEMQAWDWRGYHRDRDTGLRARALPCTDTQLHVPRHDDQVQGCNSHVGLGQWIPPVPHRRPVGGLDCVENHCDRNRTGWGVGVGGNEGVRKLRGSAGASKEKGQQGTGHGTSVADRAVTL